MVLLLSFQPASAYGIYNVAPNTFPQKITVQFVEGGNRARVPILYYGFITAL
jgi:hypothetical protein